MPILEDQLSTIVLAAVQSAQQAGLAPACELPVAVAFSRPKNPAWGDFSTALPLQLANDGGGSPLDVANALCQHLPVNHMLSSATVTAPGFLNLTLDPGWVTAQVEMILAAGPAYADQDIGNGQKAQVEFVSANPTGPLSVAHGRGAVLGDTMANLLEAAGFQVTREYYFNNAGHQMRDLGESLRLRYLQALGKTIIFPEDLYQGEYLVELAQQLVRENGAALAEAGWEAFKELGEAVMMESIQKTLERLNIQMDVFFNENSLYEDGSVWAALEELRRKGCVYEKDDAIWFAARSLGGQQDRVFVRSNGEPTYRLPDIAYHCHKLQRGFQLIVDVLGADHKDAFPDVVRGVKVLGYDTSGFRLLMNQFVTIKGEHMSTRAGRFTLLDELIDEVGTDVVRYFMLMRSAESHLEFDLQLAMEQSEKNQVYYVQFAHARLCSILRKAAEMGFDIGQNQGGRAGIVLSHPSEQALIRQLLELPGVITRLVNDLAPHSLTTYARDLANAIHIFYRDCLVLNPAEPELTQARLKLVSAARIGLRRTLDLIGVAAPERMESTSR